jgi:hypothetical protein
MSKAVSSITAVLAATTIFLAIPAYAEGDNNHKDQSKSVSVEASFRLWSKCD